MKNFLLLLFTIFSCFINAQVITTTLTTAGAGSYNVPCGVTSLTVQCWGGGGGGGGGGSSNANGGGGAGGGGYSTSTTFTVASVSVISYTVGAAGTGGAQFTAGTTGGQTSIVSGATTVSANGGNPGGGGSGGTGGTGSTGASFNGGSGASGTAALSGGGGEGACTTQNGTNGAGITGGANACNGGNGGNGNSANNAAGVAGAVPGGGGGGGTRSSSGGAGGGGQIIISYNQPVTVNAGADQTLGSCATTTTSLNATAIGTAGWTGSWACIGGCSGVSITTPGSPTSGITGLAAGGIYTFQWIATHTSGCTITDEMTVTVPACAQTNDNCSGATNLSVGAPLLCGQNTMGLTTEGGECLVAHNPFSLQSAWYRFTASNDSIVLNFLITNNPSAITPNYILFGPFAAGAGCVPGCGTAVAGTLPAGGAGNNEFGGHTLLTGLATTGNNQYLILIEGYGNANLQYCISVEEPEYNSVAPANALVISNCGATFTGTTNGGYYANSANLDGNLATQVAGAGVAGGDVTYAVNNLSWFKFCSANLGTYSVQFDVLSCLFSSAANSGSQMAILTGTNNNMTNIWQGTNPTTPATPIQTSPSFTLAAGACAYLVVDGWNGDACSYSYVLTNIAGGCLLLPVSIVDFTGTKKGRVNEINWLTSSEERSDYFIVERSKDGLTFENLAKIKAAGNSKSLIKYRTVDDAPFSEGTYYRLQQTDIDGYESRSGIIFVANEIDLLSNMVVDYSNPEQTDFIYYSSKAAPAVLEVISATSGTVQKKEIEVASGKNIASLNNSGLASGLYFIKLTLNGKTNIQKFIVY